MGAAAKARTWDSTRRPAAAALMGPEKPASGPIPTRASQIGAPASGSRSPGPCHHPERVPAARWSQGIIEEDPEETRLPHLEPEEPGSATNTRGLPFYGERDRRLREEGIAHLVEGRRRQPNVPISGEDEELSAFFAAQAAQCSIGWVGVGRMQRDGPTAGASHPRPERIGTERGGGEPVARVQQGNGNPPAAPEPSSP